MASATLKMNRAPKDACLTATIYTTRQFHLRMSIGKFLLRLAAWVMSCGIEFENVRSP